MQKHTTGKTCSIATGSQRRQPQKRKRPRVIESRDARSNSPEVYSHPPSVLTCIGGMAPACHVAALLGYTGIRSHAVTCNSMGVPKHLSKPGQHLRTRRLSLGLTLRDVHVASLSLARELRKPAFVIPPSRLHDIEMKKMTPSIHRLYTLARVYRCRLNELLWWYGIPPR